MPQATIGRWGKSLAVRIPGEIAEALGLSDGQKVEMETRDRQVVIRKAAPRFTLKELFAGKTAREWRALYRDAYDWGPDVGREVVDE